ncbi:hypothetical protein HKD37_19G052900 [Glycine soja]
MAREVAAEMVQKLQPREASVVFIEVKSEDQGRRDIRDLEGSPCCSEGFDMGGYSVEFEIPETSDSRTKKKVLQTAGKQWRQFKSDLTRKWALAANKDGVDDTICESTTLARRNGSGFVRPAEIPRGSTGHLEAKHRPPRKLMAKKTKKKLEEAAQSGSTEGVINPPSPIRRHMTSETAKEIVEKIDSLEEQASQGSFVPHGLGGVDHRKSDSAAHGILQLDSQMQSQGLALPLEPEVGPPAACVSTKGSCVDPSPTDPKMGDSDKYGLYIEENPSRLVVLGKVYEGSTVGVEKVKDAEAPVPVPIDEVQLVGQALNTFLAWPTYLVKRVSEQATVSPAKPPDRPDPEVMWDATVFGVFNPDFPLYIKHEDLSKIAHGGQCLSIFVIQLWILHLTETSMRARNSDVYGFLEPQSIQRSGQLQFESESYIKSWMQSSKRNVYLRACLNGSDNYLKGIINSSALKGLNDTPQPKSKAGARWIVVKCNRQKGSTECGYYVMHWMSTIILGTFRNNWETYFNDVRPLEAERLKVLRIQWAYFYLKVRNQS